MSSSELLRAAALSLPTRLMHVVPAKEGTTTRGYELKLGVSLLTCGQ